MVRKLAYCQDCGKKRKVSVEFVVVGNFDPTTNKIDFGGFGDIIVRCVYCYCSVHNALDANEIDDLINTVIANVGLLID